MPASEVQARSLTVAVLATASGTASTIYGMVDLFLGVGRDWDMITGVGADPSPFHPRIVASRTGILLVGNEQQIQVHTALADLPDPDVVCIPDLFVAPTDDIRGQFPEETGWLRACYMRGSLVATSCSGSLLLAEAGLLDGEEATTHWGYCDAMRTLYPKVKVLPQRSLVISGEGQRLVMAGGGVAWYDVALYLVARFVGVERAMQLAKVNLMDWHHIGQQPYAALQGARQSEDAVVADCQVWAAQHYDHESPVNTLIDRSGLSERSFKRRFQKATGMSPLEYVHTLRLEEAKQMLESGDDLVEDIARAVGYGDASFFSRLFKRRVGLTPAQYRRRFGSLRAILSESLGR